MGVSAEDKEELQALRDSLASRITYLDDQVAYGKMDVEEKQRILIQEYGTDYRDSLSLLNTIIHDNQQEREHIPHSPLAIGILVAIGLIALLGVFFLPSMTGAVVSDQRVMISAELSDGGRVAVPVKSRIAIQSIRTRYSGSGEYTLMVGHPQGSLPLLVGDADGARCPGCGVKLTPPLELELRASSGRLAIESIVGQ